MASQGEIRINQAKRGYDVADDSQNQVIWYNPYVLSFIYKKDPLSQLA